MNSARLGKGIGKAGWKFSQAIWSSSCPRVCFRGKPRDNKFKKDGFLFYECKKQKTRLEKFFALFFLLIITQLKVFLTILSRKKRVKIYKKRCSEIFEKNENDFFSSFREKIFHAYSLIFLQV